MIPPGFRGSVQSCRLQGLDGGGRGLEDDKGPCPRGLVGSYLPCKDTVSCRVLVGRREHVGHRVSYLVLGGRREHEAAFAQLDGERKAAGGRGRQRPAVCPLPVHSVTKMWGFTPAEQGKAAVLFSPLS